MNTEPATGANTKTDDLALLTRTAVVGSVRKILDPVMLEMATSCPGVASLVFWSCRSFTCVPVSSKTAPAALGTSAGAGVDDSPGDL